MSEIIILENGQKMAEENINGTIIRTPYIDPSENISLETPKALTMEELSQNQLIIMEALALIAEKVGV